MTRPGALALAAGAQRALDLPMCGRCGKPVDRVETYPDASSARIVFVAYCHGEHEEAKLDEEVLEDRGPGCLGFGVAFASPPALPPTAGAPPARIAGKSPTRG